MADLRHMLGEVTAKRLINVPFELDLQLVPLLP